MSNSGKTTYLGRLWLGAHGRVGKLQAAGLPEQLRPLREVSSYLLRNEYPPRTRHGEITSFSVPLRWDGKDSAVPFVLSFTDYAGEELEQIFSQRDSAWSDTWKSRSTDSVGLLLFVRPYQIRMPRSSRLIEPPVDGDEDLVHWKRIRGEPLPLDGPEALPGESPEALFDPLHLPEDEEPHRRSDPGTLVKPPTAVTLVEVLQFLRHERGLTMGEAPDSSSFRVAVALTCWDAVPQEWRRKGPEPFLPAHFPLLHDFLKTNFHPDGVRVFGLSSTGGDLQDKTFLKEYERSDPEQMGELVYHPTPGGNPVSSRDISLPIGWLLEGESALPDPPTAT
jgi:hypothetical protein